MHHTYLHQQAPVHPPTHPTNPARPAASSKQQAAAMASFGKRDLGLILSEDMKDNDLMATADDTAADVAALEGPKAKLDPSRRVQRLRPGAVGG